AIVSDGRRSDTGRSRWDFRVPFPTSFANSPKGTFNVAAMQREAGRRTPDPPALSACGVRRPQARPMPEPHKYLLHLPRACDRHSSAPVIANLAFTMRARALPWTAGAKPKGAGSAEGRQWQ